jgi:hypothetical protein
VAYAEITVGGVKGIAVPLRDGFVKVVFEDGHTLILASDPPAAKMDGAGGGWSAPTSATSGIAGYELGGERRRRKPKKQRNSLNLDPHSGAKAM